MAEFRRSNVGIGNRETEEMRPGLKCKLARLLAWWIGAERDPSLLSRKSAASCSLVVFFRVLIVLQAYIYVSITVRKTRESGISETMIRGIYRSERPPERKSHVGT